MTRRVSARRVRRNKRQAEQKMVQSEREYRAWLDEQRLRKRLALSPVAVAVRIHIANMGSAEQVVR